MDYTHWWGPHLHWFWVMPCLVMILMFTFVAYLIRRAGGCRWGRAYRTLWTPFGCCRYRPGLGVRRWADTPRQILDQRYASGEITNEQYERIKRDIESSRSQHGPSDPS